MCYTSVYMIGRPSKLTDILVKEICEYIATGNTFERACRLSNISESIFYDWKAKGEKEKQGKYLDFLEAIKKAGEKFKQTNIDIIQQAAKDGTWQAAAWLLERKHPEEFGRRDRVAISMDSTLLKWADGFDSI